MTPDTLRQEIAALLLNQDLVMSRTKERKVINRLEKFIRLKQEDAKIQFMENCYQYVEAKFQMKIPRDSL